jgi:nucleoside-diphosphate-sugar epimerase
MAKTILLTGATGFLGSHLLEVLLRERYQVVILKRSTSDTWRIEHLLDQVKTYDVDQVPVEAAFEGQQIDAAFHTACNYGRNNDPISSVAETNLMFGLKLLEATIQFNTDTFFNTDTLLRKQLNDYTLSKKQFVEWLKKKSGKIQIINLKLEHMYGSKDDATKFVPWVISQLSSGAPEIRLTKGEQKRDFIYVDDVVSGYLLALEKSYRLPEFSEFDVGTGELVTVREFIENLKDAYEARFGKVSTKLEFGALPYRDGEMMSVKVDNRALSDLGWRCKTSRAEGIRKIIGDVP